MKRFLLVLSLLFIQTPTCHAADLLDKLENSQAVSALKAGLYGISSYITCTHGYTIFTKFIDNDLKQKKGMEFAQALARASVVTVVMGYAAYWCAERTTKHAAHALQVNNI